MVMEVNASTVIINGEAIAVSKKPKYKRGVPKVTTNTSLVGDEVHVTQNKDFTDATGMVAIKVRNTLANIKLMESWQDNVGKNAVHIVDNAAVFSKTFNQMSVEADFEIDFDSEETEVVFKGGQGV